MPIRYDETLAAQPGIVLFHAPRSNCSARVRLLLAEKKLGWESRLIDLRPKQNRTSEYFAVNPKGLLPSLIYDNFVVTESNDILHFLEARFSTPAFISNDPVKRASMDRWMSLSSGIHLPGIKTLNYAKNVVGASESSAETGNYRVLQTDPELLSFHAKVSRNGFSEAEILSAETLVNNALAELDATLAHQKWLAGDTYSLADICWAPTIPTLLRSGLNLSPYANLLAWHQQISVRPAYVKAVNNWEEVAR